MDFLSSIDIGSLVTTYVIPWTIRIVSALAVYVIGRWIIGMVIKALGKVLTRSGVDDTLNKFLGDIASAAMLVAVILASLSQLGVDTTSVMAVFAAAGLAVGLALKDSLANFSSGVMLILFKPFAVGDFIEAGGVSGVVESISVFCTIMKTGDNREIIIPNGAIYGGVIVNYTARATRRIDLVMGIGYDDDMKLAKQVLADIMDKDDRILADPAPGIALGELADSSVNFNVRPWVKTEDYWAVRGDLLEAFKEGLDAAGVSIPYPQQDVHMHQVESSKAA